MSKLLSSLEAKNVADADDENLILAGDYRVKIVAVGRSERKPDVLEWKFRIMSGQEAAGRTLRAWTSTAPNGAWALKRLIKHIVDDWTTVQQEDLEGRIVKARVTVELRTDINENTNRVTKLMPWDGAEPLFPEDDEDETT